MSDVVEILARGMRPGYFAILDKGQPSAVLYFESRAFENAIKVCKRARKDAALCLAALEAAGKVVVPIAPTEAMVRSATGDQAYESDRFEVAETYTAMLAARPSALEETKRD